MKVTEYLVLFLIIAVAVADIHKAVVVVAAASVFQTYLLQALLDVDLWAILVVDVALIHKAVVAPHKLAEVAYCTVVEVLHTVVEVLHIVEVVLRKGAAAYHNCSQGTEHLVLDTHKLAVAVDNRELVDKLPSVEQPTQALYSTEVAVSPE